LWLLSEKVKIIPYWEMWRLYKECMIMVLMIKNDIVTQI